MKKLFITFLILLLAVPAFGATYHIKQTATGTETGASEANADSVAEFNADNINGGAVGMAAGDTIYFSGTITSSIIPPVSGSSGNRITLDGYATDDTTYNDLEETENGGRALIDRNNGDYGIKFVTKSYFNIQDFEITDCLNAGITIQRDSHDYLIRRNFIYKINDDGLQIIYWTADHSKTPYNITVGGSLGQGNVLKNIGQDPNATSSADIAMCAPHDLIISYNHLYADDPGWGVDGITSDCTSGYNYLIEYNSIHGHNYTGGSNDGEDGIDLKNYAHDIIIRYNHIYDHQPTEGSAVNLNNVGDGGGEDSVYIYGNRFEDNVHHVYTDGDQDHIYIFSNLFIKTSTGSGILYSSSDGAADSSDWHVFNNTFAENSTSPASGGHSNIHMGGGDDFIAKNNIFYKGRPNDDYRQYYITTGADDNVTFDYNWYYWPSQTSTVYWGDAGSRTIDQVQAGSGNGLPQEMGLAANEDDPGLTSLATEDYSIAAVGSAVVDAGYDMGTGAIATLTIQGAAYPVYWDIALGSGTVWGSGSTLPVIDEERRDDYGPWDIGAYLFRSAAPPSPTISHFGPQAWDNISHIGLTAKASITYVGPDETVGSGTTDYTAYASCKAAYYMNNDGGDETDRSGEGETLTQTSGTIPTEATFVTGFSGTARDFELGESEYLTHADGGSTDIAGVFTLVAWIEPEDIVNGEDYYIFSKYDPTLNQRQYCFKVNATANGEYKITGKVSSNGTATSSIDTITTDYAQGVKHHVAFVYDGSYLRIYIDGQENPPPVAYSSGVFNGSAAFAIGCYFENGTPAYHFDGPIDETGVFNVALSSQEINDIYTNGLSGDKGGSD